MSRYSWNVLKDCIFIIGNEKKRKEKKREEINTDFYIFTYLLVEHSILLLDLMSSFHG